MKYKFLIAFLFVFFTLLFISKTINADIISLNSGGNENIAITPDAYIEGFFSCVPQTCSQVGVSCGNTVEQCGLTLDCGSCASGFTCTAGACVSEGAGGGGGGGGAGGSVAANIIFDPEEFNINLAINTNVEEKIIVTNLGNSELSLSVSQQNLDGLIFLSDNLIELGIGESKTIDVVFIALSQTGIFTGKIIIGGKTILVSLNIRTKLLLFDSNIVVLNRDYLVRQGDKLETEITLIPFGDPERLDVTLNYVIKDFDEEVFLTHSETLLVEEEVTFRRDFDTGILPIGAYVVGLELVYPNGVAPSSASFTILERAPVSFGAFFFYLLILLLIIAIIVISILIYRWYKKQRENQQNIQ